MAKTVSEWLDAYAQAWRDKDAESLSLLFTQDAVYRSSPTKPAHQGRAEIAAYWQEATRTQEALDLRFGRHISQGDRVAVEWWAVLRDPQWRPEVDSSWVTLPGCLVLTFTAEGLCQELREYYNPLFGEAVPAPHGWGR